MEHIVQFAIGIDDDGIRKRIEESAYDDVISKFAEMAARDLPRMAGWKTNSKVNWRYLLEDRLDVYIEQHSDDIIDAAADKLCESFKRTKKFREAMANVIDTEL